MTELIWDGKYNKDGKKNSPVRIALPFQTIETVNESAQDRQRTLDMFAQGRPTEWRNRLIWGDKKYVLPSLLPEFAGKVNLIYIDPPFDTGSDFSYRATIPDNPETIEDETTQFTKRASIIEQKAYRDTWGRGLDSYLNWFYETIIILRELLHEDGLIYIHLDWHVVQYVKVICDEVFGYDNFLNDVVWCYRGYEHNKSHWNRKHDNILFYAKSNKWIFNYKNVLESLSEVTLKKYKYEDKKGKYRLRGRNIKGSPFKQKTDLSHEDERKYPDLIYRQYLTEGTNPRDWFILDYVNQAADEKLNYQTQKPEALLNKFTLASSKEGDLVFDCFVGSGTTISVAEKLNRRWIACDLGRFSIHTARKRLLDIPNVKPFVVQNLGKYERQQWMGAEFQDIKERALIDQRYRHFIVQLYQGVTITGYSWLHGVKAGRMIHIGSVDAPVSIGDVKNIVQEFWKSVGKTEEDMTNGVDILGWEFAFELNETAKQFAAANNVDLKFKKIPTEVLEKKAVEQGDIKFYELASLSVDTKIEGQKLTIQLSDFIVPPDDVPEDVRTSITHWQQWVDYWAVDWNFRDDTFHNEWQSYRTKKEPGIELQISHKYEKKGKYQVVIKVIDILGNDTTKMIEIEI